MKAPTVDASMSSNIAQEQLQEAINFIAKIATTVGDTPISETFGNSTIRAIAGHFIGIEQTLANLATDPIPF